MGWVVDVEAGLNASYTNCRWKVKLRVWKRPYSQSKRATKRHKATSSMIATADTLAGPALENENCKEDRDKQAHTELGRSHPQGNRNGEQTQARLMARKRRRKDKTFVTSDVSNKGILQSTTLSQIDTIIRRAYETFQAHFPLCTKEKDQQQEACSHDTYASTSDASTSGKSRSNEPDVILQVGRDLLAWAELLASVRRFSGRYSPNLVHVVLPFRYILTK